MNMAKRMLFIMSGMMIFSEAALFSMEQGSTAEGKALLEQFKNAVIKKNTHDCSDYDKNLPKVCGLADKPLNRFIEVLKRFDSSKKDTVLPIESAFVDLNSKLSECARRDSFGSQKEGCDMFESPYGSTAAQLKERVNSFYEKLELEKAGLSSNVRDLFSK